MKTLKKEFLDRGLNFKPVSHPTFGTAHYIYNGKAFETWQILKEGNAIGVFTWEQGKYKTRKQLSDSFDCYRNV